jgi:hypothetical protein
VTAAVVHLICGVNLLRVLLQVRIQGRRVADLLILIRALESLTIQLSRMRMELLRPVQLALA